MKAVVNVLLLVALVAVGLAVLDGLGIADKWAAERAVAEAERAEALAALRQAEGDALLKQAAARAVEADTTVATVAAMWPVMLGLTVLCFSVPVLLAVALLLHYGKQDVEVQHGQ